MNNLAYYNSVNPELFSLLPLSAKLIIEIGCGAGALGKQYKILNPFCQYIGVEFFAEAANIATTRLDKVIIQNVENLDLKTENIPENSVDCFVYGDVLEHLIDPWQVLQNHVKFLKDDGVILACIPNVQHWTLLVDLLRGKWEYQNQGLLDKTHLRFFTLESIKDLFQKADLKIDIIQTRNYKKNQDFELFIQKISPLLNTLNLDINQFALQTGALQYVVRAVKSQFPLRKLFIQTILMAPLACDRPRILEPDRFSQTIPGVRTFAQVKTADLTLGLQEKEKVFIWQRAILQKEYHIPQLKNLLNKGYLIIAEMDDDPFHFPENQETEFFTYRACHGVQTSTEKLAQILRQFNPNVAVFENQLAYLPPKRNYKSEGKITLFFGALNREKDWEQIMPIMNKLFQEFKDIINVKVIHDKKFYDALEIENKEFTPFCAYEKYKEILSSCDLAILPLNPTRFNTMKSDLKFIECAGHGVAVLASPTVYEQTIKEGETGLIYRSESEFEFRLRELITNHKLRQNLAHNAYEWVKNNRLLCQHYHKRSDWYKKMLDDLPRLNLELKQRIPELFI